MTEPSVQSGRLEPLEQAVRQTGVYRCLECGKCTAICPISRYDRHFSPRRTVGRALMRHDQALLSDDRLWMCLTCLGCSQVCPAGVAYSDLTLAVRTEARRLGAAALCIHGEAIHAWMRLMMNPALKQHRLSWLTKGPPTANGSAARPGRARELAEVRRPPMNHTPHNTQPATLNPPHELLTSDSSDTLYFVGCAPYYGALFELLGVDGDEIARSTLRILNALNVQPQVLADERCCGHDLLWEGDVEGFQALARLNAALIRASGARRVVTACPECARALKADYPAHGFKLDVEVLHVSELLASSDLHFTQYAFPKGDLSARITFHDPCRLGRHLGIYDAPRQALGRMGLELVEMQRVRANALCCGTNGWTHCAAANKAIQVDRLREARATGAGLLVTACIKCQIHFKCAMQDQRLAEEIGMEIKDLAVLAAEALGEGGRA
jgi:Fe-S oxidoreductase